MKNIVAPVNPLIKECYNVIIKEIAKECREEAKMIMKLTTDKNRLEFIDYSKRDIGNVCCLILDGAKRDLVKEGKMKQNKHDSFGTPLYNFK